MTKCPNCGARGVKIADRRVVDGYTIVVDYCGVCGKNWPAERHEPPEHRAQDFHSNVVPFSKVDQ